jgi:multidrug resistance protein, MATE family
MVIVALVFVPFREQILSIATDDKALLRIGKTLVPAMLVGTYLNLLVGNITSGVFSGMGRPIVATVLSFGLELPMSIGGVAIYILVMRGTLLGVYWWGAISGAIEGLIVFYLFFRSDWKFWADEARKRQEVDGTHVGDVATSTDLEEAIDEHQDQSVVIATEQSDIRENDEEEKE